MSISVSSGLTAATLGLRARGVLAPGKFADDILFDPQIFVDRATYQSPEQLATGMRYVLVNCWFAVDDGRATGVLAGPALRNG